jgi:hypothetical protein
MKRAEAYVQSVLPILQKEKTYKQNHVYHVWKKLQAKKTEEERKKYILDEGFADVKTFLESQKHFAPHYKAYTTVSKIFEHCVHIKEIVAGFLNESDANVENFKTEITKALQCGALSGFCNLPANVRDTAGNDLQQLLPLFNRIPGLENYDFYSNNPFQTLETLSSMLRTPTRANLVLTVDGVNPYTFQKNGREV